MNLVVTLFGNEMPTLVVIFVIAMVIQIMLNRIFADLGVYNYVWHPGLFRVAIFVCIFAIPSIFIYS
jgi:hypothetical protein